VFKLKRDANGQIARYKARLVARGFTQEKGVDYHETSAPTVRVISIRTLLALVAYNDWEVEQLDVVTAYRGGILREAAGRISSRRLQLRGASVLVEGIIVWPQASS
jgi:hypothetical protein